MKTAQGRSLLRRVAKNKFKGELVQLRTKTEIQFEADDFTSDTYGIDVISKTSIGKMDAKVIYPKYLGLTNTLIENASDLVVPEGTVIEWSMVTKNSAGAEFVLGDMRKVFDKQGFKVSSTLKNDSEGLIILKNTQSGKMDTTGFGVDVIKDMFPSINVEEEKDTISDGVRFFTGAVG